MNIHVFDLEADNLLEDATQVWCGVFKELGKDNVHKFTPSQVPEMLQFMDTIDVAIGHNVINYDFPLLKKLYGYEFKGKKVDTLIMSRLMNPKRFVPPSCPIKNSPHSVATWGYRVGRGKVEHNDWAQFSPEMLHRCTEDVYIQELIYNELYKESQTGDWRNAILLSFKLFENLAEQESFGWYMDKEKMQSNIVELERQMQAIDDEVIPQLPFIVEINETKTNGEYNFVRKPFLKSGAPNRHIEATYGDDYCSRISGPFSRIDFRRVDINSRNETVAYLLSVGWEPLEWNYNDDGDRTSPKLSKDDPFDGVEGAVGRLVAKRVQCRHRKSLVEGLFGLVREDGRIASAVAGMAVTGRMQHRGIVNIPQAKSFFGAELRSMFSCPDGKVLVSTDSDGNQVRQLCARMNDPAYTDNVLNGVKEDGTDIHSVNMRAAGLSNRDDAKTFFYGFLFGAGDAKIGKIVKGTAARGKQLKENFLAGLPALGDLLSRLSIEWRKTAKRRLNKKFDRMEYYDGTIIGLDGRPIKIASEHAILVYLLQSDEAIMMSAAYNWTCAQLKKKFKWGVQVKSICFYHDEYTFECDEDIAEEVKRISERGIAWAGEYYKIACPHVGQGKIGKNWYEVH